MIVFNGQTYSNTEISNNANSLANRLLKNGVTKNSLVAFSAISDYKTVICFLAIWSVGAVPVPIDVKCTQSKTEEIIKEANIRFFLVRDNLKLNYDIKTITLDLESPSSQGEIIEPFSQPENIAYIVFTSGTTSKPKGVKVAVKSVVNYIKGLNDILQLKNTSVGLLTTSMAFDLSYTVLMTSLYLKNTLVIPQENDIINPAKLIKLIKQNGVTFIKATPSILKMILSLPEEEIINNFDTVKYLILGGEPICFDDVKSMQNLLPNLTIFNHYGPCETTIGCSIVNTVEFTTQETVSIGKPFAGNMIDIVDENCNQLKGGKQGKLLIYGNGVSLGYINEKNDSFFTYKNQPAFLTEDIGFKDENNNIKLLGRTGDFVKIKGYRVSLTRVKNFVNKLDYVQNSAVFSSKINNQEFIFCFYCGKKVNYSKFYDELSENLAEYEIPKQLILVDNLPFNSNGKTINKQALLTIYDEQISNIVNKQKNETAKLVYSSWFKVGGALSIKGSEDIFYYLDSLSTITFILTLEEACNIKINEADFYDKCSTLNSIIHYVEMLKSEYSC